MADSGIRPGIRRLIRLPLTSSALTHADADAELDAFIEAQIEHFVSRGMSATAAREQVLRKLGAPLHDVRRELHHSVTQREGRMQRREWIESLLQDVRYGWRSLLKHPSFSIVAMLTLAIGIGAATSIFSVVDAVLLRPLPYATPERLVKLQTKKFSAASPMDFRDWQASNTRFDALAASLTPTAYNLSGEGLPERVAGMRVSASLFPILGVSPAMGRLFRADEDQKDAGHVVLLGHNLWQRRFGGAESAVGATITLDNERYTVVGVMPKGFSFQGRDAELWMPIAADYEDMGRGNYFFNVVGRLKVDATVAQAQSDIDAITRKLEQQYPETNTGMSVVLVPLLESITGSLRPTLLFLLGTVGCLLLIACTNVANLLLVRASNRRKEIAVRIAHGATAARIVRQLLVESALLALLGGALGFVIAISFTRVLIAIAPTDIPRIEEIAINIRALIFSIGAAVATGVLFGLVPALQSSKPNVQQVLKENSRGSTGTRHFFRNALVISEIALALVLSVGAGLMARSFVHLLHVNPGFETTNILSFSVSLPYSKYPQSMMPGSFDGPTGTFYDEALSRIAALPGVKSVGATTALPLSNENNWRYIHVEGRPFGSPSQYVGSNYRSVSANYFPSIGMRVLNGRGILSTDRHDAEPVVVVNSAFVGKYFPDGNALGKRVKMGTSPADPTPWMRVVGVVADVHHKNPGLRPVPELYRPYEQSMERRMTFAVRTSGTPEALVPAIRRQILAIDKDMPLAGVSTMEDLYSKSLAAPRFILSLLGTFSVVALLLAAIGLYGVISFIVTQRTREMGIRTALGAQRRHVLELIMAHGLRLAVAGVAAGLIAAFALTRVMRKLLFETTTTDPLTFLAIAACLVLVALVACVVPAMRATRVSSVVAMQAE